MTTVRRRLAWNTVFLYLLTLSNYFVGLLLFPFISRVLSVEGFGLVGFGMLYSAILQSIVEFGFMISATAMVSRSRADLNGIARIISGVMTSKLILVTLSFAAFLLSALFVDVLREHFWVMLLFYLSGIATAMIPDFYFRGMEQMRSIAIRAVITRLFAIALVLFFVRGDQHILIIPLALLIGNLLALFIALWMIKKAGIKIKLTGFIDAWRHISTGFMYFLSRLAVSLNQSAGAFVLGLKFAPNSVELGLYSAAARISSAGEMLLTPVTDSIYPHMINKKDYKLFMKVYCFGILIWFLICAAVFLLADQICGLLLGVNYIASGELLRILVIGCFFAFSSSMFGYNALSPIGLSKHANIAIIVSLGVNIILLMSLHELGLISPKSVAYVVASSNVVIFCYRATVFYRNRALISEINRSNNPVGMI